ncbi:ribonuclease H-like domain-containing protein [Tanacetum coccineum]
MKAKELVQDVAMDAEESIEDDVVDAQEPTHDDDAPEVDKSIWFKKVMVYAEKDPKEFDDLLGSTINFTKFSKNCLKRDKLMKADLEGLAFALLKGNFKNSIELEYNMEKCYLALTNQIDWLNPEGDRCPYDLSKPLPLQGPLGHITIHMDFFFNKDLEYLKIGNKEKKYVISLTKPKATRYELEGLEEMIPKLWSSSKVVYDLNAALGIHHLGPKRQLFYRFGYGYLKEIVVRRADQKEYRFNEANFSRLQLNDIEDMFLLYVQNKLHRLTAKNKLICDNLVMAIPNIEGTGYTKETIHVEYEWKPPRCSMCLLFGHSFDDCPKAAPKLVENQMDKGKGQIPRTDDEDFIEVKQQKSGGNYRGKKTLHIGFGEAKNSVSAKSKAIDNRDVNSFEALNDDDPIIEEVATGTKVTTTSTQEEGKCSVPLTERINFLEKQILEGKLVLVDDGGKPLEKVNYPNNSDSDNEVKPFENETASFFGIKESWIWSKKLVRTMEGH